MAVVPRLALGGLANQGTTASEEIPNEQPGTITPGRASARTRNRALLRAKARSRQREEKELLTSARESEVAGFETARQVDTVWEEEEEEHIQRLPAQAKQLPPAGTYHRSRECGGCKSEVKLEDSDISDCSSQDDPSVLPSASVAAASFLPAHAWEYPLSAAEKKERVMLIFGRTEALSEQQIRRCEKREERLRTQVRLHRQDGDRLRRERNDLCGEAASLRNENRDLRDKIRDLEKRLQRSQQSLMECARTPSVGSRSAASTTHKDTAILATFVEIHAGEAEDSSPPMTARRLLPARGSTSSGAVTSMETPRGLSMVTPRSGAARISMRGTTASVAWAEASQVPWVAFTNRSTGLQWLYGEKLAPDMEESSLSLRRGEYIRSISGTWNTSSASDELAVACSLRIVTSEQQEAVAGDAAAQPDFHFEADEDFEIVGLTLQDGIISGVKQVMLAPSRVPCGISAATGSMGSTRKDVTMEAEAVASSRRRSLQALRRSSLIRMKEAVE